MSVVKFNINKAMNDSNIEKVLLLIQVFYETKRKYTTAYKDEKCRMITKEIFTSKEADLKTVDYTIADNVNEFFTFSMEQIVLRPKQEEIDAMILIYNAVRKKILDRPYKNLEELVDTIELWYDREHYYSGSSISDLLCFFRDNKFFEKIL